jgi:hypothetical protein
MLVSRYHGRRSRRSRLRMSLKGGVGWGGVGRGGVGKDEETSEAAAALRLLRRPASSP